MLKKCWSAESEEAAYELYKESKELLDSTWGSSQATHPDDVTKSNSSDANPTSPVPSDTNKSEETYTQATLGGPQTLHLGEQKILGVKWNVNTDQQTHFN